MAEDRLDSHRGEIYRLTGQMLDEMAGLEFLLHTTAWTLLGKPDVGKAVTEKMGFNELVDLLDRLTRRGIPANPGNRTALSECVQQLRELNARRNSIAHSFLSPPLGVHIARARLRDAAKSLEEFFIAKYASADEIQDVISRGARLRVELCSVLGRRVSHKRSE